MTVKPLSPSVGVMSIREFPNPRPMVSPLPRLTPRPIRTPTPVPVAVATPAPAATPSAAATAGPKKGGTAYLLMTTATAGSDKFGQMDPQRIYTGEDLAFFGATIMQSLTAYKYSADPKEATGLVADAATDTGTANADAPARWSFAAMIAAAPPKTKLMPRR